MSETTLAQAVERFALRTCGLADSDLERPWAWGEYDEGLRYAFFCRGGRGVVERS